MKNIYTIRGESVIAVISIIAFFTLVIPTSASTPAPSNNCVSNQLQTNAESYAAEVHYGTAHVERWNKVLHTFAGTATDTTRMTIAEAQAYVDDWGAKRFIPVVSALRCLETQAIADSTPTTCVSNQLQTNAESYAAEVHYGTAHVERWNKVLHTFAGTATDTTRMTIAEAQAYVDDWGAKRFIPVVSALRCLETQAIADQQSEEVKAPPVYVRAQAQQQGVPAIDLKASSDSGSSNTDNITNHTTPIFITSGFDSSAAVVVSATHATAATVKGFGDRTGNGEVIIPSELADGVWTVTAAATINGTVVSSPSISVTIDTAAPGKPATPTLAQTSDSGVSDSDGITNITNPVVGTTTTGEGYVYEWTVNGTVLTSSTTFHTNTGVLSEGTHTASVKITDAAGNQSVASDDYTFTVDTTAPTAITNVGSIGTVGDTTPDLTFTTPEAGTLVANTACGITTQAVTSGANTITLTALTPATYNTCTINMSDVAGNTGTAVTIPSFTIIVPAIDLKAGSDSGSSDTDNITNNNTPTFTVAGLNDSVTVAVVAVHATLPTQTSTRAGNGDVTLPTLGEGVWTVSATDRTTTTATISVTVDTTAPLKPGIPTIAPFRYDTGISNSDHITSDTRPNFTVAADEVSFSEYTLDSTVLPLTGYGASTFRPTSALAEGVHTISVISIDLAGNRSVASDTRSFTIDTTAPGISGVSSIGTTADTTPDLSFTTPEAGTLVANTACGITTQAVTSGANTITLTALTPATYNTCTINMSDVAGNTGTAVTIPSFTITGPDVVLKSTSDTGASDTDNITNDTTPTFTTLGFDDSKTIVVTASHATAADVTTSRTGNGDVTLPTLAEGVWTVLATDGVSVATHNITVDTTDPTAITGVGSIGSVADTTPDLTFTTPEAGTLVANTACGIPAEAVTSGANTITLTALANGTYASCTIQMADVAGNLSPTTAIPSFTISAHPDCVLPIPLYEYSQWESGSCTVIDSNGIASNKRTKYMDTTTITTDGTTETIDVPYRKFGINYSIKDDVLSWYGAPEDDNVVGDRAISIDSTQVFTIKNDDIARIYARWGGNDRFKFSLGRGFNQDVNIVSHADVLVANTGTWTWTGGHNKKTLLIATGTKYTTVNHSFSVSEELNYWCNRGGNNAVRHHFFLKENASESLNATYIPYGETEPVTVKGFKIFPSSILIGSCS